MFRRSGHRFADKNMRKMNESEHPRMIVLIDNYDSFTFNLVHYLGGLGADVVVHRNDKITADAVIAADPDAIVLSPGPCTPNEAGICLDLIEKASAKIPILGVCLGHQAIGQAFGGAVVRAPVPVHGKLSEVTHGGQGLFRGINGPFRATRYHSLVVDRDTMPTDLAVTAETSDHLVMGLAHKTLPTHGVQFHPESIASEHGHLMLKNFLALAADWNAATGRRSAAAHAPASAARIVRKPARREPARRAAH
jgi:anthranilate synthase component 2